MEKTTGQASMMLLHYRRADKKDMPWAYALFKDNLQVYIRQTWGWDEVFQRHSFEENLPASAWQIACHDQTEVGAYCLKQHHDHLHLAMLLVVTDRQRQGIGSQIINHLKQQAIERGMPLRLNVLRSNPAHRFYRTAGFVLEDQDADRFCFCWSPSASQN